MNRRRYLERVATASGATLAGVGLAGCLEDIDGLAGEGDDATEGHWGDGETVLDPPTEPRGNPSHPIHGDTAPRIAAPDPLTDETIDTADLEGDASYLLTFIFTACPDGACPALLLRLRRAQADAVEAGYADDLRLLALTFDPERDTPEVLEEYAGQQGVDLEAGNWHFMRPENNEVAAELVSEEVGMALDRIDDEAEIEEHYADYDDGDGGHDDDEDHSQQNGEDGNHSDHEDHDHGEYTFAHSNLILLVNEDGIVERSYPRGTEVDPETVLEDVRAVTGQVS